MREILFRGKRQYTGEWAESVCPLGVMHSGHLCDDFIPETVGQYTGLTDKNGKRIFEGDIVRSPKGTVYRAVWSVTAFYLRYDPPHEHGLSYNLTPICNFWNAHGAIIEVIGNIHDNPELLKGE